MSNYTRTGELYALVNKQKRSIGVIPANTCPDIDESIKILEELRKDNEKLRELGIAWYEFAEELSTEANKIIEDLESDIKNLEEENSKLQYKIDNL